MNNSCFHSTVIAFVAVSASGQIVVYDFTGEPGDQASTAATINAANLTAAAVSRGSGLNAANATGSINSSGWTTGTSLDANDYYGWSLTPADGYSLNLTEIRFTERRSASGILSWELRSSLDGFASAVGSATVPDNESSRTQTVSLDSSFSGIAATVEFRLYGFNAESAAGTWRLSGASGLEVYGSVVPEPHEYAALAGLGLLGFAVWRRSRRA